MSSSICIQIFFYLAVVCMQKIWSGDSIKCYQGICFHRNCPLNVRLIASCEYCSRINWWCSVFIYSCRGRKATFKYAYIHQLWDDQEDYGWKWNKGKQHQNTLMWILIFIYKPGLSQARTRKYLRCTFHNHEIFCPKLKTSKIWVGRGEFYERRKQTLPPQVEAFPAFPDVRTLWCRWCFSSSCLCDIKWCCHGNLPC